MQRESKKEFIAKNRLDPILTGTEELSLSQREIFLKEKAIDNFSENFPGLEACEIIHPDFLDENHMNIHQCFEYLDELYGGNSKSYYYNTFKKHIFQITGFELECFRDSFYSDTMKVFTLCYQLSRYVQNGLALLGDGNCKGLEIETKVFFPLFHGSKSQEQSAYLSRLLADMLFRKEYRVRAFLKNLDLGIGALMTEIQKPGVLENIQDIIIERSEAFEPLSNMLVKCYWVNDKKKYIQSDQHLVDAMCFELESPQDELEKHDVALATEGLLKYYLHINLEAALQEYVKCGERKYLYSLKEFLEKSLHRLRDRIKHLIVCDLRNDTSIAVKVKGEKNAPGKSLLSTLKKFAFANRSLTLDIFSYGSDGKLNVHNLPMRFESIPEAHIRYWGLRLYWMELTCQDNSPSQEQFLSLLAEKNAICFKVIEWVVGNNTDFLRKHFQTLEDRLSSPLLVKNVVNNNPNFEEKIHQRKTIIIE